MNDEKIKKWLDDNDIQGYTIHEDLTVSVDNPVDLSSLAIDCIPFKFREISGMLNISHCKFTTLKDVGLPKKCDYFFAENNRITSLEGCPETTHISLENNCLTNLDYLPSTCEDLNIAHNHIASLKGIKNSNLESLRISFNPLNVIDELSEKLYRLEAESCHIKTLPVLPEALKVLYCGSNELISIPPLSEEMAVLDLSRNEITDFSNLPARITEKLVLDNNIIRKLPPKLYVRGLLSLNHCFLSDEIMKPINLTDIKRLFIANNPLSMLDLPVSMIEIDICQTPLKNLNNLKDVQFIIIDLNEENIFLMKDIDFDTCISFNFPNYLKEEYYPEYNYTQIKKMIQTIEMKNQLNNNIQEKIISKKRKI